MTPREKRRFRKRFAEQVEQERNGKPIDGDILERMTKPKDPVMLHQVVVTVRESGRLLPVGPAMIADACGLFAETIRRQIVLGRERTWANPIVVPLTPISQGTH